MAAPWASLRYVWTSPSRCSRYCWRGAAPPIVVRESAYHRIALVVVLPSLCTVVADVMDFAQALVGYVAWAWHIGSDQDALRGRLVAGCANRKLWASVSNVRRRRRARWRSGAQILALAHFYVAGPVDVRRAASSGPCVRRTPQGSARRAANTAGKRRMRTCVRLWRRRVAPRRFRPMHDGRRLCYALPWAAPVEVGQRPATLAAIETLASVVRKALA